jgi:hypothetical protein
VIPIPSQDHGESFTERRLQNHTDFAGLIYVPYSGTSLQHQIVLHSSDPEMTDQDPFFIASFLEACILFDPGGDVATLPMCGIKNGGVQYDTVNVIDLEWTSQDPFGIKIKQVQCDGVAFSLFNIDVVCAHHETSQMLMRTSFPITLIADASKGGHKSKEGIAQSILYSARAPIGTGIVGKLCPASSASAALGSSVFSSMKGMLICGPKENGIFLQGTTTPLCAGALLCVDPSMATSALSSCHLTLLKTIDTMANSFSYRDLMIDWLYGTKVLILPALMGRDELSGSIFGQHFLLVTSPDSDGTVLPFDRGPAKLLTASVRSLKLLPFDRGPISCLLILQAILEISFKMMILLRYSSYRNYLLRYMCINFLGNKHKLMGSDRNYTAMHTHVQRSVHLSALLIT